MKIFRLLAPTCKRMASPGEILDRMDLKIVYCMVIFSAHHLHHYKAHVNNENRYYDLHSCFVRTTLFKSTTIPFGKQKPNIRARLKVYLR